MLGCIHLRVPTHPDPFQPPQHGRLPDLSAARPSFFLTHAAVALLCGCNTTSKFYFWNIVSRAPNSVNRFSDSGRLFLRRTDSGHPLVAPCTERVPELFHLMSSSSVVRPGLSSGRVVCLAFLVPHPPHPGTTAVRSSARTPPASKHRPLGSICLGAARHHPLD